jgi:ADP-heptose:LPS heptosyltransferase
MKIIAPGQGWALGDALAVTPTFRELRRRWPKERITLEGYKRPELWLHNPNLAGGTEESGRVVRFTYGGPRPGVFAPNLPRRFASEAGVELVDDTPEIFLTEQEKAQDFGVDWTRRTVAIDIWANEHSRRWPAKSFQDLARRLMAAGWQVLECGRESIAPRERIPCSTSFLNKLSVRETAALYRRCSLWIGCDSGGFHLAAAVGTPQVVMFSTVPWTARAYWTTIPLQSSKPCDCASRPFPERSTCEVSPPRCLNEIPVDRVLLAVDLAAFRYATARIRRS